MEIGGYFGLGLEKKSEYHKNCLRLNTGRNCLEYISRARGLKKIYLPFYVCNQLLEPLRKLKIDFDFYSVNEKLDPLFNYLIRDDEAILFVNYFGLKQLSLEKMTKVHSNLIVDNTQAFFSNPLKGVDTFYSARKFFGVPDGAYLFANKKLDVPLVRGTSYQRMQHLLKRTDCSAQFGYDDFLLNENELENAPIELMSNLTESLLSVIDYKEVKRIREENFLYLHKKLEGLNDFKIDLNELQGPMVYPFYAESAMLKKRLIDHKIFVPTYWREVHSRVDKNSVEAKYSENLLALPIDHRYTLSEMKFILNLI